MAKLIDKLETLMKALRASSDNNKITDEKLRITIATTMGHDPRTIDGYLNYLTYFGYVERLGDADVWVLRK